MSQSKSGGINAYGLLVVLLTVLFIGLKLTHHIDWEWWWVLGPLWVPIVVVILLILAAAAVVGVGAAIYGVVCVIAGVLTYLFKRSKKCKVSSSSLPSSSCSAKLPIVRRQDAGERT